MKIRQITADNIKIGRTGRETFEIITQKLTEDGFNVNAVQKFHKDQDPEKTQVFIDLHALGKGDSSYSLMPYSAAVSFYDSHNLSVNISGLSSTPSMIHKHKGSQIV